MTLYIVVGTIGEYSDRREWMVAAYEDEELARRHVELASARGREIIQAHAPRPTKDWDGVLQSPSRVHERNKEWKRFRETWKTNQYDPEFTADYNNPAWYRLEEVTLRENIPGESA